MGVGGVVLGWLAARAGYPIIFVISAAAVLFGAFLITRTIPARRDVSGLEAESGVV